MDSFPLFHDQYYDKWKICPPIGSNMADNIPLITLLAFLKLGIETKGGCVVVAGGRVDI
jgi:hypothetical protein